MLQNLLKTLPEELIKQRKLLGLSQKKLGELAEISEQTIQRYESLHYATASLTTLLIIARVLKKYRDEAISNK